MCTVLSRAARLFVAPLVLCLGVTAVDAAGTAVKKRATVKRSGTTSSTVRKKSANTAQAQAASKSRSAAAKKSRSKTSGGKAATAKSKKSTRRSATTWRNRQTAPTPERYREIQEALAAKGYLKPGDATGQWTQSSIAALKKFQTEQNIEATGKLNSLSIIALGLGPKYDSRAALAPRSLGQSAAN